MTYQRYFILLIMLVYLSFSGKGQSYELYRNDTINRTGANGKKYGRWVYFFNGNKQKIEKEGKYESDRKTGIWKTYYENGNLKSEITYINNIADGYAKIYYENGKISEEGTWKGIKWVGKYLFYHENGNKAYEWSFNDQGKRTGEQKYYHENGKLMIKGDWIDGKENGVISEYDSNGNLKSEKVFASGAMNEKSSKFYATKKVSVSEIPDDTNATSKSSNNENQVQNSPDTFTGNGSYRFYNSLKKVEREGDFRNGKLIDGKKYYYNADGKLIKTEIFVNGKVSEIIK